MVVVTPLMIMTKLTLVTHQCFLGHANIILQLEHPPFHFLFLSYSLFPQLLLPCQPCSVKLNIWKSWLTKHTIMENSYKITPTKTYLFDPNKVNTSSSFLLKKVKGNDGYVKPCLSLGQFLVRVISISSPWQPLLSQSSKESNIHSTAGLTLRSTTHHTSIKVAAMSTPSSDNSIFTTWISTSSKHFTLICPN